ncbi:MAG: exodeoxyribonuclease III [Bacteroidota bacterium]|jgi:exodeoxyribonuclease-3
MRIITYNVNGIRSAISKGLLDWMRTESPDVLCLQEIKASPDQVGFLELEEMGYHHNWYPAQKKGYSGVAIFSKQKPDHVEHGCGIAKYDDEGRVIRADFGRLSVVSVYHPSGSSGDERQAFKMEWLEDFQRYAKELKKKRPYLVLSGDYNICHKPIDIHNPVSNANTSGFKPEEREWMENFLSGGYIDTFRHFNPDPHHYSWWSYRANSRAKNLGWRIDYNMATENLKPDLVTAKILPDIKHSDHCPVMLELKV